MTKMHALSKWWTYQRERFPLAQYIPMVLAFSFCAVSYSAHVRQGDFSWPALVVAFFSSLIFFVLLRIADEFKDREEDARFRPYRPVPRGLVTLKELATIGVTLILVQATFVSLYEPALLLYLLLVWLYFALMTKEFFVPRWLKRHPIIYLISHMLIMPLIDFFATACDWLIYGDKQYPAYILIGFLAASFFNGIVIEFGRKIRAQESEEAGVETYSALWGQKRAVGAWVAALSGALLTALVAAQAIDALLYVSIVLALVYPACIYVAFRFLRTPTPGMSKMLNLMSGIWTLVVYLSLGAVPFLGGELL